jgi:hypothetical protein
LDWNAIGAVGEILGALAVVITLLYLSKQIKQNSQAVKLTALRDSTAQWNHWSELLATSPGLAEIVARGNESYKSLPTADAMRYGAFIQMFYDNIESGLALARVHNVDRESEIVESIAARRVRINGYREWLDENSADYDSEFIDWVREIREKGD